MAFDVASLAWQPLLVDQPHRVLDHDDRVVDHDPDGEHQAEQRQVVDRLARGEHHRERPDQRDTGIVTEGTSVVRQSCRKM